MNSTRQADSPDGAAARVLVLGNPPTLVFGAGCASRCGDDLVARGLKRAFIVTGPTTRALAEPMCERLRGAGLSVTVCDRVAREPTVDTLRTVLAAARDARADAVVGFGGGS